MRRVLTRATTGRDSRHQQHNDGSAIIRIFSGARSMTEVAKGDAEFWKDFVADPNLTVIVATKPVVEVS